MGYELLFHGLIPESGLRELLEQVVVDHLKLARQDPAGVNVAGVGLDGLVVAQDLSRGGRGHGGNQEAVSHTKPEGGGRGWSQATPTGHAHT